MNVECPFCKKKELDIEVECHYVEVPLYEDGYEVNEGQLLEDKIERVVCRACGKEIPVEWVFD